MAFRRSPSVTVSVSGQDVVDSLPLSPPPPLSPGQHPACLGKRGHDKVANATTTQK